MCVVKGCVCNGADEMCGVTDVSVIGSRLRAPSDCPRHKQHTSKVGRLLAWLHGREEQCKVCREGEEYAAEFDIGDGRRWRAVV